MITILKNISSISKHVTATSMGQLEDNVIKSLENVSVSMVGMDYLAKKVRKTQKKKLKPYITSMNPIG